MNCQPCKDADHAHCIDVAVNAPADTEHAETMVMTIDGVRREFPVVAGRLYRSCFCQHKSNEVAEPATGAVIE